MKKLVENRKKFIIAFVIFLTFMWIFTLISKSIYTSGLTVVTTVKPVKKYIEHKVEAQGIVVWGGEQAFTAMEGLRIDAVFVRPGDKVEEGDALLQVDLADLAEMVRGKENEIRKIELQLADLKTNKELAQQKKQLEEQRARENYSDVDAETGRDTERAEEAKNKADNSLNKHKDNPVSMTSDEERNQAWEKYKDWVKRKDRLEEEIDELVTTVTALEVLEDERNLTQDEKEELEKAKADLDERRASLKQHVKNEVSQPDFSGEDSAKQSWEEKLKLLEEGAESAGYGVEDSHSNRDSSLKSANQGVEDSLLPSNADSQIEIMEMELADLKLQLASYQEIMDHKGNFYAQEGGRVTEVRIGVGDRIPGTAVILLTDSEMPCRFKVSLTKEQKKYVRLGDKVEVRLDAADLRMELAVDYLMEVEGSPGNYEALLNLPEDKGIPGLGGMLYASVMGEAHEYCIPAEALYKQDDRYYVYVVKQREGILGTELYAEQVNVNLIDQNSTFAAIEGGVIDKDSEVITVVSEEIGRGEVVRY